MPGTHLDEAVAKEALHQVAVGAQHASVVDADAWQREGARGWLAGLGWFGRPVPRLPASLCYAHPQLAPPLLPSPAHHLNTQSRPPESEDLCQLPSAAQKQRPLPSLPALQLKQKCFPPELKSSASSPLLSKQWHPTPPHPTHHAHHHPKSPTRVEELRQLPVARLLHVLGGIRVGLQPGLGLGLRLGLGGWFNPQTRNPAA